MELRSLGSTELRVSPLGLGTVKFGRNRGVKYPRPFELPSDREALTLLELAWDLGMNLLDTAPAYGESEERLGRLLRRCRRDWVIVTKVGEEFQDGESRFDFSAAATRASVERSLRRLGVDALDAVLIHSSGDDLHILEREGVLPVLLDLQRAGWVRSVGMSTKTVAGGLRALECCDVVMVTYNLSEREEWPVIQAARAAGKGVLIKKGLHSGHLDRTAGIDPVRTSMELIFAKPGVSSVVVGTLNPAHLRANVVVAENVLSQHG
ncbi:aldo/keto reductase [Candidatus Competibacter phosphatis]|uniref:Aldo/keto reductase n=1 Tax=Candidatus Competibacter phosphatis TaxID=221280 RepID=A0ABX1TNR4_9GAMM|nr:aldo/keto reductase [Candidatus Competibacter phosphatis]NMQ20075.1 aldo/keto reductase [Candidatus Competibacter phosphatis]